MNVTIQHKSRTAILLAVLSGLFFAATASAADLHFSAIQPKSHRVVFNFAIDAAKAEELQRWVNEGHDPWCRDAQLVAVSALRRISSRFEELEPASLERESHETAKVVYTFHSFDGQSTYRVTLRRYRFLRKTAGSIHRVIWIPETAEIITRDVRD